MVSIVLGDILYLMGSGSKINSFVDYFIKFQSHSIYYYLSMFLGMVNAYAIPAKHSFQDPRKCQGKKALMTMFSERAQERLTIWQQIVYNPVTYLHLYVFFEPAGPWYSVSRKKEV